MVTSREESIYNELLEQIAALKDELDSYIAENANYNDCCLVNWNGNPASINLVREVVNSYPVGNKPELVKRKVELQRKYEELLKRVKTALLKNNSDRSMAKVNVLKIGVLQTIRRGGDLEAILKSGIKPPYTSISYEQLEDLELTISVCLGHIAEHNRRFHF